jgi:hypothetical protein
MLWPESPACPSSCFAVLAVPTDCFAPDTAHEKKHQSSQTTRDQRIMQVYTELCSHNAPSSVCNASSHWITIWLTLLSHVVFGSAYMFTCSRVFAHQSHTLFSNTYSPLVAKQVQHTHTHTHTHQLNLPEEFSSHQSATPPRDTPQTRYRDRSAYRVRWCSSQIHPTKGGKESRD